MTQIETVGRRAYVTGDTYTLRDRLRAAGAHWDPERRAWWVGTPKRADLEAVLAQAAQQAAQPQAPGLDAIVAGRATYRGRGCYLAGRIVRGQTHWDDEVAPIQSRDGHRQLCYSRDGERQWWAALADLTEYTWYQRPQTIARLRAYAEEARQGITHHGGRYCDACGHDGDACADMDCTCRACGGMMR